MATFMTNAFGKTLSKIEGSWKWITETQEKFIGKVELWEIEPDKFGNHFVIITRYPKKTLGHDPKIKFLKKVREL